MAALMTEEPWNSVHIRCDGDLDSLMQEVILPCLSAAQERSQDYQWFFLRYWEHGPHIRLRFRTGTPAESTTIRAELADRMNDWLPRSETTYHLDQSAYEVLHRAFSEREKTVDSEPILRPDGQIWDQDYVAETNKYGHGKSLQIFEQHFQESSTLAALMITRHPSRSEKWTTAVGVLLVSARLVKGTVPMDQFRAMISRWGQPAVPAKYNAEALSSLLLLATRAASEDVVADPTDELTRVMSGWAVSISSVLRHLNGSQDWTPDGAAQVIDICGHLFCNRIGLSLDEEISIRSVVAAELGAL